MLVPIQACPTCGRYNMLRADRPCTRCYHLPVEERLHEIGEQITGTVGVQLGVFNELRKVELANTLGQLQHEIENATGKVRDVLANTAKKIGQALMTAIEEGLSGGKGAQQK